MHTSTPVQTTYTEYQPVGLLGQVADMSDYNIDTRIAEDPAGAGIGLGILVCQGTLHGDKSAAAGQLSGSVVLGVTVLNPTQPIYQSDDGIDKYQDGINMPVITRGDVWVAVNGTVVAGAQAYYNSATGALGNSSISNPVAITRARWMTSYPYPDSTTPNPQSLAKLRLDGAE